ncbi:MAG: hypothetical protein M1819_004441 [Sarea resinae]|nr:MAG: hypothetical protein M1819_004441 [Sarea resinae]
MVLEEASNPDFSSDPSPSSDSDPYSSEPANVSSYNDLSTRVNVSELPRPIPIIGPLFGYHESYIRLAISARFKGTSALLQRPLTQDEMNAIGFYTAKMISYASYGRPLGLAGGLYQAARTAEKYRFPFITPNKDTFDPMKFLNVRGNNARILWHGLRGAAYGFMGSWIGGWFFTTYAAVVAAVGEQGDPRLKDVIEAIRERATRASRGLPVSQQPYPSVSVERQQQQQQSQQTGSGRYAQQQQQQDLDDASPSSGGFYDDIKGDSPTSDTGVLSDSAVRTQESRSQPSNPRSQTSNPTTRASTFSMANAAPNQPSSSRSSSSSSSDSFADSIDSDDASPTAGQSSSSSDASGSGSVWDRIRRDAASSTDPSSGRRNNGAGAGAEGADGFSFSRDDDEDRGRAREEAQREFDARVERERGGDGFDGDASARRPGGAGRGGRW